MDPITAYLEPVFGTFPEPVIFLFGGEAAYSNESGSLLLHSKTFPKALLFSLAEHPNDTIEISLGPEQYRVTVSSMEGGCLLVLRPLPSSEEQPHPFSNAVFRMRECLSNLTATQWRIRKALEAENLFQGFEEEMATQTRMIYQMLRLTRQAELTQELNTKTFPRQEGFDLAMVCQGMAEEAGSLADLAGVRFSYHSNVENLAFQGSKSLLTQMLLALVSNGIRAAGRGGYAEMRLQAEETRCIITVRDSGIGIPEDRLSTLFSGEAPGEIPRPGEGAGLGLYNAQRIATLHGGVVIAQSGQDGGACLVVSLPIIPPLTVPARNNPGYDNLGGYSPVRIELSDVLPWQAFTDVHHINK